MECFRLLFEHLAWIKQQFFEWHKRFKEGREYVRDDERCGRNKKVNTPELIDQWVRVRVCWGFKGVQEQITSEEASTLLIEPVTFPPGRWISPQFILVTDYLTKMGIKTVPQPPYSPDIAPCEFWLFPKLRGCRYETTDEVKEAVTKAIVAFWQEDFYRAFQKLLERYNKCIAAGGDYFEGD